MNRLLMSLAMAFFSIGAMAADDCLNFTDLVKQARADVAAGAQVQTNFTDLNWTDAEPDAKWLGQYGDNVASLQTDWLMDAKAPLPQQVGCERIKNMGDLEMIIARSTKEELELHVDGEIFVRKLLVGLAKSFGKISLPKPKVPVERRVVRRPSETQEEAVARTVAEAIGDELGDAVLGAIGEALSDPKVQEQLERELMKQGNGGDVKRFKEDIETRIRFTIRHEEPGEFTLRIKNSYGEKGETRSFETTHIVRWGKDELPKVKVSARVEAFLAALAEAKKPAQGPALP